MALILASHAMAAGDNRDDPFAFLTSVKGVYQSQWVIQSNGSLLLIWVQKGLYALDLFVARQQADGAFSHPLRINHRGLNRYTGDEARPSVAVGPDGSVHTIWLDPRAAPKGRHPIPGVKYPLNLTTPLNNMNNEIKNLEPKALWKNFANLGAIPRPSKKEEKVRQFMVAFGEKLNLETMVDPVGNVIIKKPASKGMENRKTIVMQSHLDMVCQKNSDIDIDFDTQGIKMFVDGDWVKARGTTLGADNGIGVASIMGVLESTEIIHPAIEALFTIDEETGMTGALGLQAGYLNGEILLNLDTEDDAEISMGCAGGIDITAFKTCELMEVSDLTKAFKITVSGLRGGHSGMDIHKGFANANKLMNRILFTLNDSVAIAEIDGGSLRNAIPRDSKALIVCDDVKHLKVLFNKIAGEIRSEYLGLEKDLQIIVEPADLPPTILSATEQHTLLKAVYAIQNGVFRMSPDIDGLVETSNSLARVVVKEGNVKICCLTRSSVESGKMDLAYHIKSGLELGGFKVELSGSYPGWKPNPDSAILKVLEGIYANIFNKKPQVLACHAGLECGILGTNYPQMDMISFGPTIKGAHSPDERASISSSQKYWKYLLEILKNIPAT